MTWRACMVMMVVAAGCGDNLSGRVVPDPPVHLPPSVEGTAPVDSPPVDPPPPVDTPPSDLAELCGAEPVTIDDWEDCYQRRLCDVFVGCSILSPFRDVPECISRLDDLAGGSVSAERRERKRAIESGRASLDVAEFTQCLAETSRAFCNTVRFDVACAKRFAGRRGDGGDCYTDIECASPGATCESSCTGSCCLGTCQPKFKRGQACDLSDSCEPGLVCNHTCKLGESGAPCADSSDCDPDAWCHAGHCAADLAPDAACTSLAQCGGETTCVGLSILDSSPGQCLPISHVGDHCDFACYGNLYCDATGTCRDLPELGQNCSLFIPCRGVDTICSNGQCVLRGDIGATCGGNQLCRSGLFCSSELNDPKPTCGLPGGTGAPCADPSHCESYRCSGDVTQLGVCLAWSETCPLGEN